MELKSSLEEVSDETNRGVTTMKQGVKPKPKLTITESSIWVKLIAIVTLGSGVMNIISVIRPAADEKYQILRELFPLEFIHFSRWFILIIGLALLISALNIYQRKKRAFNIVLILSIFSTILHLGKGLSYIESALSLALATVLFVNRKRFTVKSGIPSISLSLARVGLGALAAFCYGVAGFWFLEHRDFHIEFHFVDAIRETVLFLLLLGDPNLVPLTHFAGWFLNSLYLITVVGICYAIFLLFRPVYYKFKMYPRDRVEAKQVVEKHGRSAMDFFKYWPDKSYFFSTSRKSFIAYRVGSNFALALADPVGPEEEIEELIVQYTAYCRENSWGVGFHQTLPDFIPLYEKHGFKRLKIGDDAIVDLIEFNLDGRKRKELRHTMNRMETEGVIFRRYEPPLSDELLYKLSLVSDEWLTIPGRRERQFTLGTFEVDYLRLTPVCTAEYKDGTVLGFLNEIPSFYKGEATIDLMRRKSEVPDGLMDFLFVSEILYFKAQGYSRFNLGMAPMSGFTEHEESTREERAIHFFFQNLNFLFNYQGLKHFKAKYAHYWEPRYEVYRNVLELPKMILALREIAEIKS